MRIWHQSTGVFDTSSDYYQALQEHVKSVAGEGVEVDLHGMEPGWIQKHPEAFPHNEPNKRHGYTYVWALQREDLVRNALRAEAEGYDAFVISIITDVGLEEIRSLLKIPVIGFCQSSMLFGASLGTPIGFVVFVGAAEEQVPRLASLYGLRELLGPIVHATYTYAEIMAGFKDPTVVVEKFTEAAERAVAQGAKVLIPGEAPVNTLLAHAGISEVAGVPVIDSMGVSVAYAEMRARFFRRTGLTHADVGFYYATPPKALIDGLREQYFGEKS